MVFEDNKYRFDSELLHYIILKKNKKAHSMVQGCQPAELHDSTGSTLLHYSAQHGNTEMTEYFIERGCEIEAKDNDEFTPLMLAVKNRHLKTFKFLLEAGANIYPSERSAGILLKDVVVWISLEDDFDEDFHPIRRGVLEPILQKIKENLETSDDQAIAKLLLESDCPLHHVICTLKDTEFTRYYLANGYSVDAQERTMGRAPLFMAVSVGDLANVKVLLEHGANVNVQDYEGKNILCFYAGNRLLSTEKLEILRILMKSGASLSSSDIYGVSVAEKLFSDGQKEVVNIVLPYADLTAKYGSQKNTVLHALIQNNNTIDIKLLELLSEQYFDINAVNSGGVTALQFAIRLKIPVAIIDFMLRIGADISAFYTKGTLKNIICRLWSDSNSTCVKIIELFFLYGGDLRKELLSPTMTILNHTNSDKSSLAKVMIAHISLLEEAGQSVRELFVPNIDARPMLTKLFEKYKLQIEDMKKIKVYESITMLDLIATNEKKLLHYVANDDLISNFEVLSENSSRSGWYYYEYAKKRIARAVDVKKCQRKASLIISDLTGIQQQLILDKIVDYLRVSDFNGLFLV